MRAFDILLNVLAAAICLMGIEFLTYYSSSPQLFCLLISFILVTFGLKFFDIEMSKIERHKSSL